VEPGSAAASRRSMDARNRCSRSLTARCWSPRHERSSLGVDGHDPVMVRRPSTSASAGGARLASKSCASRGLAGSIVQHSRLSRSGAATWLRNVASRVHRVRCFQHGWRWPAYRRSRTRSCEVRCGTCGKPSTNRTSWTARMASTGTERARRDPRAQRCVIMRGHANYIVEAARHDERLHVNSW
jgi:hypothetical protein